VPARRPAAYRAKSGWLNACNAGDRNWVLKGGDGWRGCERAL
jgi:hypothetical protein